MSRILVIEDEEELRELIAQFLQFHDHDVSTAEHGLAGLEAARSTRPDLIISDVMMPKMDGFEVLEALREDQETADIPFLFLTAKADRQDMRRGMELGADDYLTKPFEALELIEAVDRRLARHESFKSRQQEAIDTLHHDLSRMLPHELRTPLSAILGYGRMLRDEWTAFTPQEIRRMLDDICAAGARLERLSENYSVYAGLLTERNEAISPVSTPLEHEAACSMARLVVERLTFGTDRAADVSVELSPGVIPMESSRFTRMLTELLDNALKFSTAGDPVQVAGSPDGEGYRLEIVDHGQGMSADQIARTGGFKQFDRDAQEQQGTGLGLAIARMLAERTGGWLHLVPPEAPADRGLRVEIQLGPQAQ
ncbi:MAG: response regulator [Bradymonadia bacterium]